MSYPPQQPYDQQQPSPVVSGPPMSPAPYTQAYPPQPGYGYPPPQQYQPPASRRRTPWWPLAALAAALVFAASGVWLAYDRGLILKDSGVKACEALAAGDNTLAGGTGKAEALTESRYREMREVFEDSRHEDIRDHGTKLMDVVWQVSQAHDETADADGGAALGAALVYMQPLTTHMTGLQSACADQGVIVTFPKV